VSLSSVLRRLARSAGALSREPRRSLHYLLGLPESLRRSEACRRLASATGPRWLQLCPGERELAASSNPLRSYFDEVKEGPGVWKWLHYFDIYHRHLSKFVGRDVTLVEVGVSSGGSMPMWRHYFGTGCRIHGVDIQEACKVYEDAHTKIHIGDQADRAFWKRFREHVPTVDVLIDDGGHQPEQQMVTLEEMLPHLRPGGVYICEDVHGCGNGFAAFAHSLADHLNAWVVVPGQRELACLPTPFQAAICSVHLYPFVVVIEKSETALDQFVAPKHGTEWQPFS
jgi:hypothetical protein